MEEFPYYGLSWFLYLIVAVIFLLVSSWKTKKWSPWIRIPLLTFIAAMALTPGITISGQSWWSPAAIIMVFEIDQQGIAGASRGAIPIVLAWIFLMIISSLIHWKFFSKKTKSKQ